MPSIIPETAPFTVEQRAWLNGFMAGLLARENLAAGSAPAPATPLTILFGSQTGTAERLAKQAAKTANSRGFNASVLDMGSATVPKIAATENLLVVTSTYGEGEPPDNAKALFTELAGAGGDLSKLRFSVCSLGDSNYAQFCQAGKDIDTYLEKHGARRAAPRTDCDVDYDQPFASWLETALGALGGGLATSAAGGTETAPAVETQGRSRPFSAPLLISRTLNGAGSDKEVRHVEISLAGSGLAYEAGDALGVYPQNCPELVGEMLALTRCDGEEEVQLADGALISFRKALSERCDLGKPSGELVARLAGPAAPLDDRNAAPLHVADLLKRRPESHLTAGEVVRLLRPIAPRLYSISSSPKAHSGQVHLTVGVVRYSAHGRNRKGVCSTFLAERVAPSDGTVPVFIHSNSAFRLPADPNAPIIMIGPGTGIAPFRAFLHERRAIGAKGRCWLFFGDRHAASDFLYADEIAAFQRDGVLTSLDTAFSRDQEAKIYVQHRIADRAAEMFAWLEEGASLYVCGDAARMAKDVDAALQAAVEKAGGKTADQAQAYVRQLRSSKRYLRDVY
jgi:sulfite reductase (NADPH) flavoprotein alpha-component